MKIDKIDEQDLIILVHKISRLIRKYTVCFSETHEPSMIQLYTMMVLSEGKSTMSHIADELCVKMPTATSLVERLVSAGLAKRISNTKDRRIIDVQLTSKGKKTLSQNMKIKMKRIQFVLNKISTKDKLSLFTIMQNLYKKLETQKSI